MADSPLGTIGLVAVTLYVKDFDAALAWYDEKLGLQPMSVGSDGHNFAAFSLGGAIVVLEPIEAALEPAALGAENTTLNVMVDRDPAEVRGELTSRGVTCGELVFSNYVSFLVRDPDGNRFYVSRPATDQAQRAVDATSRR
ncbi:MAG: Glyoxalase/Bleomycin resistance protein/Dioxygenase superfamily [Actinomycetota bacterium]|jgi:catechol 2,3-dioxygenase-like lactoylglutathione lyase family enzyme